MRPGSAEFAANLAHFTAAVNRIAANDESRDIIFKWGIGINDADNGVYLLRFKNISVPSLPNAPLHGPIHTGRYYASVAQRFMFNEPTDTPSCLEVLQGIKEDLVDGSFPWREE